MKHLTCVIIWILIEIKSNITAAGLAEQCTSWHPHGRLEYHVHDGASVSQAEAARLCAGCGAKLTSVSSTDENQLLYSLTADTVNEFWLGLSRTNVTSAWTWSDGEPYVELGLWFPGEPSDLPGERCVRFNYRGSGSLGAWGDTACDNRFRFICKRGIISEDLTSTLAEFTGSSSGQSFGVTEQSHTYTTETSRYHTNSNSASDISTEIPASILTSPKMPAQSTPAMYFEVAEHDHVNSTDDPEPHLSRTAPSIGATQSHSDMTSQSPERASMRGISTGINYVTQTPSITDINPPAVSTEKFDPPTSENRTLNDSVSEQPGYMDNHLDQGDTDDHSEPSNISAIFPNDTNNKHIERLPYSEYTKTQPTLIGVYVGASVGFGALVLVIGGISLLVWHRRRKQRIESSFSTATTTSNIVSNYNIAPPIYEYCFTLNDVEETVNRTLENKIKSNREPNISTQSNPHNLEKGILPGSEQSLVENGHIVSKPLSNGTKEEKNDDDDTDSVAKAGTYVCVESDLESIRTEDLDKSDELDSIHTVDDGGGGDVDIDTQDCVEDNDDIDADDVINDMYETVFRESQILYSETEVDRL